jgi:hypothetical protein
MIPTNFKIAGGKEIQVNIVENINDGKDFGVFNDATNIIKIANKVRVEDDWYNQTEEDMERTYLHELFHVFQFYSGKDFDEMEAQMFSNFMYEYNKTKK